jgi:hypothetical protein
MIEFSDAEIEAAARQLLHEGQFLGWWGEAREFDSQAYDKLDPIGREEFDAIVDRVLRAAANARSKS